MTEGAATFQIAPEAYDRHVGRYSAVLSAELIRVAGVRPGQRALDVGCGPGGLTRALADLLGPEHVAAVDPSEPFVAECRRRVPGADVRLSAAEDLPFPGGEFDAVLSQLVLNFLTDAQQGAREMARVARPGGVVASCLWDYSDGMKMLRAYWDAAAEVDPEGAPVHDEGRTSRYFRPDQLEWLWKNAGLAGVLSGAVLVRASYRDFGDLWAPFGDGVGPSGAYCLSLDPERREALHAAFFRRLGSPAGSFELSARAWYVTGAR